MVWGLTRGVGDGKRMGENVDPEKKLMQKM